jgi:hypothetical protein
MASNGIASHNLTGANLEHPEVALLELAADNPRDVLSLSEKEKAILRLYDQIQELELEQAVLEQGMHSIVVEGVDTCESKAKLLCSQS